MKALRRILEVLVLAAAAIVCEYYFDDLITVGIVMGGILILLILEWIIAGFLTRQPSGGALTATASPAPTQVVIERPRRSWAHFWVFLGAAEATGFFVITLIAFILAYDFKWIPHVAMVLIVNEIWPFVCLVFILSQLITLDMRRQVTGADTTIGELTSVFPAFATIGVLLLVVFGVLHLDIEGWRMFALNVLTSVINLVSIPIGNKMIAAARGEQRMS